MYYSWGHSLSTGTICEILRDSYQFWPIMVSLCDQPVQKSQETHWSPLSKVIHPSPFWILFNCVGLQPHGDIELLEKVRSKGSLFESASKAGLPTENNCNSEQYPCSHRKTNTCKALPYVQNCHGLMDFSDSPLEYQVVHYNNMQAFPSLVA